MATVIPQATHNSSPGMTYYMDAEQTGGSGTQRTIKITLYLKCGGSSSASWYGYPVNWKGRIHNSYSGFMTVKGTESWNGSQGFRSFTWTATVDVGTTASTNITVGFETDSYNGSSNWDLVKTGTFTVGKTNTAPYFTSGEQWLRIRPSSDSGTVFNGYYPENISYLYIDWGYASDDEGGTIEYSLNQSVNGGGWAQVDWGTDRAHGINIGSGNEGQRLQYYVDARDNGGLWSNKVYSATITKNTLNGGSFSGHSNDINYHSTSVTLHINAGSNTDGSVVKYMCYSDNVTVYNQQDTTSPSQTITIWKSGNLPSGPYIKFDDLKNYFAGSNYNGRLHVGLKTSNNYGTSKWSSGSIGVDLRINPQGARNQAISTDSNLSPMYKKVASTGNYYFLPNGSDTVRIHWNNGWGLLGESIRYELYVAYGSGSWQKIADMANIGEYIGYDHVIGTQTSRVQFKYLIRTITSYGYYTDVTTSAQNLDYYNAPSIYVGTITRTSYTAEVKITVKSDSSIPNISTVGTWECRNTGEMISLSENPNGNLSPSQQEQLISIDPLFGEYQHILMVNYKDNTGFSNYKYQEIKIPANQPVFFINKYGVGINGLKADSDYPSKVKGNSYISGTLVQEGVGIPDLADLNTYRISGVYKQVSNQAAASGKNYPSPLAGVLEVLYAAGVVQRYTVYEKGIIFTRGFYGWPESSATWTPWRRLYDTIDKPSASDVGALPITGGSVSGTFIAPRIEVDNIVLDGRDVAINGKRALVGFGNSDGNALHINYGHDYGSVIIPNCCSFDNSGILRNGLRLSTSWEQNQADVLWMQSQPGRWTKIGAQNTVWSHFATSTDNGFYFYQNATFNEGLHFGNYRGNKGDYRFVTEWINAGGTASRGLWVRSGNEARNLLYTYDAANTHGSIQRYSDQLYCECHYVPANHNLYDIGFSGQRWRGIWTVGGNITGSDISFKENITPIETDVKKRRNDDPILEDYFNFVKDDLLLYSYDYKLEDSITTLEIDDTEEQTQTGSSWLEYTDDVKKSIIKSTHNIGFIAQDYDLETNKVAQQFIFEDSDGKLVYKEQAYVGVLATALKFASNKIEVLETELSIIKEKIGII